MRGGLTLGLHQGNDVVLMDDTRVWGNTTIKTGAGNDSLSLEGQTIKPGRSIFHGAVNISMGSGHDSLSLSGRWLGEPNPTALNADFRSIVKLDGGASASDNTLIVGDAATFFVTPVILNFPTGP